MKSGRIYGMKNKMIMESTPISQGQKDYLKTYKMHQVLVRASRILLLLAFLALWEGSAAVGLIDSFFFSRPLEILSLFLEMTKDYVIFIHIGITLWETLLSFFLVTVLSILFAIGLFFFPKLAEVLEPVLVVLNSLPKSALAPLIIVWLGTGMKTIIIAGMSVALFGSIINMYTGFSQVDEEKIKLIQTLGGTKKDTLVKVIIPFSVPVIISNMKVNIGLALVGVIIGEFLAARQGLGYLIIYGSQVFQLDLLIMSIIILCIIAIGLYQCINLLEKRYLS